MLRVFFSFYFFLLFFTFYGTDYLEDVYIRFYQEILNEDLVKDYQGFFILIENLKAVSSHSEMESILAEIDSQSNTPVAIKPLQEWRLDADQRALLMADGVLVTDYEDEIVFKLLSDNSVLQIGPLDTTKDAIIVITRAEWLLAVFLGLISLLWIAWQQYKIKRLAQVALRFSQGQFDHRAPLGIFEVLGLSQSFNTMAARIKRLFQSHKHLTNAVSHELRSPITRIRFQLELLSEMGNTQASNQLLVEISNNLDDMDQLVDEMLSHAKMERTEFSPNTETIDFIPWLQEQKRLLETETNHTITLALPDETIFLCADKRLMARLLRNLVSNANNHTRGKIIVGIENSASSLTLWVDDDGPGIPIDQRERLFEPFVRLDKTRSRRTGGFGLGLSIVAQIVRCHKGSISIQDNSAGGSRFLVTLNHSE
jgi:signal transduction histidine kinase